jgi:hypothetical protein
MAVEWTPEERAKVEAGIAKYPATGNGCAALARIIYRLARPRDERARGIQLNAPNGAPWLILRRDRPRQWASHTLVETQKHNVDALTGADGCASDRYLAEHFLFPEAIQVQEVDVFSVDAWVDEDEENES